MKQYIKMKLHTYVKILTLHILQGQSFVLLVEEYFVKIIPRKVIDIFINMSYL